MNFQTDTILKTTMNKIDTISLQQARKMVLLSQKLPPTRQRGSALTATLSAIEHLGYIQIDTISAIQRAHHHTLWNRNPRYKTNHLGQLFKEKKVFEYWSHAAAYLPMRDYRYTLPRKHGIASGHQNHWYKRNESLMKMVLQRIAAEGPLMAKDFEHTGKKMGEWQTKPAKQALEYLFMQGDLMIPYRVNFHKVYDLTERVLPEDTNTVMPTTKEHARFLILQYLRANGLGQANEMVYLLKNTKAIVLTVLQEMMEQQELLQVKVGGNVYYALPSAMELLSKPLSRSKLKILSPFDNLLIQRKRTAALFDFDYLLECYTPEAKRKYGYFSLPILWNGKLVARMDCKADRKNALLQIRNLTLEPKLVKFDAFAHALVKELKAFMVFNDCSNIQINKTSPSLFKVILQKVIKVE